MSKTLVAYFSASGRTAKVAEKLASAIQADIYEITPEIPYTKADLNWMNKKSRSSVEMSNHDSRPAIGGTGVDNIGQYDVIFVGFPIWWYIAPTIVNTFLESYDLAGKKIVLFATSGSSGFGRTVDNLRNSAPGATIVEGRMLNGIQTEKKLKEFGEEVINHV